MPSSPLRCAERRHTQRHRGERHGARRSGGATPLEGTQRCVHARIASLGAHRGVRMRARTRSHARGILAHVAYWPTCVLRLHMRGHATLHYTTPFHNIKSKLIAQHAALACTLLHQLLLLSDRQIEYAHGSTKYTINLSVVLPHTCSCSRCEFMCCVHAPISITLHNTLKPRSSTY